MRKRLITPTPPTVRSHAEGWLDVERAPSLRSHPRRKMILSSQRSFRDRHGVGVQQNQDRKPFGSCLTSRRD